MRSGSTKQELKGAALDRFLLQKQGRHWDGVPLPGFTCDDLSAYSLAEFRRRAGNSKRLTPELLADTDTVMLDKLRLFDGSYLKRAAVMLFHADPELVVTGAFVKIGDFRTDSDLLYQDEVHGDLASQVTATLDLLLTKYLRAGISYVGVQRVEKFPVPEAALREAIINAVAHKDYASGVPIQISVYHDKLMIWNPGHLPPDWTLARLTSKHASSPYNPNIANAFFRMAFLESWGRGIDLMRNVCIKAGLAAPTLRWDNGLCVTFAFAPESVARIEATSTQETTQEAVQARLIVELRSESSLTVKALATRVGLTADGIKYHLAKMKLAGVLRRVGSTKAGRWEVLPMPRRARQKS